MEAIQPGNTLKASFWQEKVKVFSVKHIGAEKIRIDAVGLESSRFYNPVLSQKDIELISVIEEKPFSFTGNAEGLFLFLESHRIGYSFQFGSLYAVNVSCSKVKETLYQMGDETENWEEC